MRFMILLKSNDDIEAGKMPREAYLAEMQKFNEELMKAGVLLGGEGLHPSSKGVRVTFSKGKYTVVEGPFPETTKLICGYWLWQCKSMDEAIDWVKRIPMPSPDIICEDHFVEIRPLFEDEDFGEEFTPELREKEARLRAETERLAARAKP